MRNHTLSFSLAMVISSVAGASVYEFRFESSTETAHGFLPGAKSGWFSLRARFDSSAAEAQAALPMFAVSIAPIDARSLPDASRPLAPAALTPQAPDGAAFQICFVLAGIGEGAVEVNAGGDAGAESGESSRDLKPVAFDSQWSSLLLPNEDQRPVASGNDARASVTLAQPIPGPGAIALFALAGVPRRHRRRCAR